MLVQTIRGPVQGRSPLGQTTNGQRGFGGVEGSHSIHSCPAAAQKSDRLSGMGVKGRSLGTDCKERGERSAQAAGAPEADGRDLEPSVPGTDGKGARGGPGGESRAAVLPAVGMGPKACLSLGPLNLQTAELQAQPQRSGGGPRPGKPPLGSMTRAEQEGWS